MKLLKVLPDQKKKPATITQEEFGSLEDLYQILWI